MTSLVRNTKIPALDDTMRMNNVQLESSKLTVPQMTASSLNGRLVVNAGNSCCLTSIPKMINRFFTHRHADVCMFFRSYNSMSGGTTLRDINRRINEITQLVTVIETCGDNRGAVRARFQRLSPQIRDLFFYVDQNYMDEFVRDPSKAQEMAQEMIRECDQVIHFQRQLTAVNAFYRLFGGGTTDGVTTRRQHRQEPTSDFRWDDWWARIFPDAFHPRRVDDRSPATTTYAFNFLNVPGTVPYIQNAIPADVQRKADEINSLKGQFIELRNPPPVPDIYNDIIMGEDFMALPIFDASHPAVQNALSAASALAPSAISAVFNRDLRHLFDKDALEAHIRTGTSWAPAKCPTCRHPTDGGIRREFLRIDTALQDEILQFLRTALRP
jgi:hypothetical protein